MRAVRASWLRFLAQVCVLLAIAASVALLVDTLGATPAYCSGPTGCHVAKLAAKRVLGAVPLPLLALVAFFGWLVAMTWSGGRVVRKVELLGALLAGSSGAALLLVQAFVLGSFCPLCVVVDVAAILAAVSVLLARRVAGGAVAPSLVHPIAIGALVLIAAAAPLAWPHFRPAAVVPPPIAELAVPNRVTIVEFVDLACSHCRELYPLFEELRREQGDRIHFVRLHAPLRGHRHARQAARLLQCLEPDHERVEKLTQILFETPELDRDVVIGAAESVGMNSEQVETCWADPASEAMLEDNLKRLELLGFQGLPTTYVGGERIVGAMPKAIYLAALDRVGRSSQSASTDGFVFGALLGMLVLGVLVVGRRRRSD